MSNESDKELYAAFEHGAESRESEIESLRQRLNAALDDLEVAKNVANGNVEAKFDAWKQLDAMEHELAAALAACKAKDELIRMCAGIQVGYLKDALAIQPDDSALKDKAMTTYEQPKDWIERHLVEDPGGLLACEPSRLDTLNEELRLARQANEAQHQQLAAALDEARMANVSADEVRSTYAEEMRKLRKQLSNHIKREVMLRDAMNRIAFSRVGQCESLTQELFNREMWAAEVLAVTADLDGLILCNKKPTAWCQEVIYEMAPEFAFSWFNTQLHYLPLYRAWEPK
jgi:hypothetical protein